MSSKMLAFDHPNYYIQDGDRIIRRTEAPYATINEQEELLKAIASYIEGYIIEQDFVSIPLNDDDREINTSIMASGDWETAEKLLVIVHSGAGYPLGIFSRSILMEQGLSKGSIVPYIKRARKENYAVVILRPNMNHVEVMDEKTKTIKKIPIEGSETPEIHALGVWETIIPKAENCKHIALLGLGNGASLCKDIYLRQMVRSKEDNSNKNIIKAFITIEASQILDSDDGADIKAIFKDMAINMECNTAPAGYRLGYLQEKYHGITTVSLGLIPGTTDETKNANATYTYAMEHVFQYLKLTEKTSRNVSGAFVQAIAQQYGHTDVATAIITTNPNPSIFEITNKAATKVQIEGGGASSKRGGGSVYQRVRSIFVGTESPKKEWEIHSLGVDDFEYLKVVGRGAFGKVMQVKKKSDGAIYAMKILKKSEIIDRGQVEHTMAEKEILCAITHPFIVSLKYSFQTKEKLYIITDYYNGGSLYFHLKKSKKFTEERAKFYCAELLSGLSHLHSQQIIYRDLKLENVLMDHMGHIALTDFGLSKQNIDKSGGATTFCGTAEYIAPELLYNRPYGAAVDWWSFGIILYEMVNGTTPYFNKNRKLMYQSIAKKDPSYPAFFSPELSEVIAGLLIKDEHQRLGAGAGGANDIMNSKFFKTIDFNLLYQRQVKPPFKPEAESITDTNYVPSSLLNTEAKDSIAVAPKKSSNVDFGGFTYNPDVEK